MSNKIRALGIAPYENMKIQMETLAQEFPQMELTIFVGDRDKGLEIAKQNFHGNFDIVISRGGTASMLKKELDLPVIEIEITSYDLLCSLKLAGGLDSRVCLICADNMAPTALRLKEVLGLDMVTFGYGSMERVQEVIRQLNPEEFDVLLCDMVAYTTAKTLGLNAYLIISAAENIRRAFEQAMFVGHSQSRLQDENLFLRELLHWQIGCTTILDDAGSIYLSTPDTITPELLSILREELPECIRTSERRINRSLAGTLYVIRTRRIFIGSVAYTAFFYEVRRTPLGTNHTGIRAFTRPEVEERYCRSVFSTSGFLSDAQDQINRIARSTAPIMILGEDGTGKESAVDILYLHGPLRNNPQIHINCAALGEKEWEFLLEHHNSPLADEGSTLYFFSVDTLTSERCRRLLSVLQEMQVYTRNRVCFSCICPKGESMSRLANEIVNSLCCLTVELPCLRELAPRIPQMINMYISRINVDMPTPLLGVEPEAVELLQQYPWPYNFSQFRRVMNELAAMSSGQIILARNVRKLLRRERHVGSFSPRAENAEVPLDLTRTLDEINQDIVRCVVAESGGNQSAAAKRLGISRTTLWRMIQAGSEKR